MIKILEILIQFEDEGAGFFNRNSNNTFTVWIRGAHGNDPNQWHNARELQRVLGVYGGDIQPDPQSGHLRMSVRIPREGK